MIFWVEPDEVQFAELKKSANTAATVKTNQPPPIERTAQIIAELIRTAWTPTARPANATRGQRDWVAKLTKKQTCGNRSTNEAAYNLIAADPSRFNLRETGSGKGAYYVAAEATEVVENPDNLNPEQEELF